MKKSTLLLLGLGMFLSGQFLRGETVQTVDISDLQHPTYPYSAEPYDVWVNRTNNFYYFTDANNVIAAHDPTNQVTWVVASGFKDPRGLAFARGGLVVADSGNHAIRHYSFTGGGVTTLAGGLGLAGAVDGSGATVRFNSPSGLAVAPNGDIYIADQKNNRVRILHPDNSVETLVTDAVFNLPSDVAIDPDTLDLYVASAGSGIIHRINDGIVQGASAALAPRGLLWVGGATGLVVSDASGHTVSSGNFYTGFAPLSGLVDGVDQAARFNSPMGMGIDSESAIVVADLYNRTLRRIVRKAPRTEQIAIFTPGPVEAGQFGLLYNDLELIVSSPISSAEYRYTFGSAQPTLSSAVTDGPISLSNGTVNLNVRPFSTDVSPGAVISSNYVFAVAPLILSPKGATNNNDVEVTLSTATLGAEIYYTLDGTAPVRTPVEINGSRYEGPIVISSSAVVAAKGYRTNFTDSEITAAQFILTNAPPQMSPAGASANAPLDVTLTSATTNAVLFYTIDGTAPNPATSPSVTNGGSFELNRSGLLQVLGTRAGFNSSVITSNVFSLTVANPVIAPDGGSSINPVTVSITTETPDAQLIYTLDGTNPSATNGVAYTGAFALTREATVKAIGRRAGFADSAITSASFAFSVATPVIAPSGADSNDTVEVTLSSATTGATLLWTIDGSIPALDNPAAVIYSEPFDLEINGMLQVRGFREGFQSSEVASNVFNLRVDDLITVDPPGTTNFNAVTVTATFASPGAALYWTIDGSEPATSSALYTGPFTLATNGVLKFKGLRPGFVPTTTVTNIFRLYVDTPAVTPPGISTNDLVTVSLTNQTVGTKFFFTTNGTEPTESSTLYSAPIVFGQDTTLKVKGFRDGFIPSETVTHDFAVHLDPPVLDPPYGYFPDGVSVTLNNSNPRARIYYRLDGQTPTETNALYTSAVRLNDLNFQDKDLRAFTAKAFVEGIQPSDVARGADPAATEVRVSRDVFAGVGARVLVPVVVNAKPGDVLRSLQYRLHVYPDSPAVPNLAAPLATPIRIDPAVDFIHVGLSGNDTDLPVSYDYGTYSVAGPEVVTNVVELAAVGEAANFKVEDFGIVDFVFVTVPRTAAEGDVYWLEIAEPSATSDAHQEPLVVVPGARRQLIVRQIPYIAGDSGLAAWYNAGDFGNGNLNNNDVNNAFHASIGLRVPFAGTDLFDAMDVFPPDIEGIAGGDGQIRFLDWQHVLRRSLRSDPLNWERFWDTDGVRRARGGTLNGAPNLPAEMVTVSEDPAWSRQAALTAGSVSHATPGQVISVPLYISVNEGERVAGLQFLARIAANESAPPLAAPIQFSPASGMPSPAFVANGTAGVLGCGWSVGAFSPAISSERLIGHLRVSLPANAAAGHTYSVRFTAVDASPDLNTQYDCESFPGTVWVSAEASQPAEQVSDEWKRHFFGAIDGQWSAPEADPDGDGLNNLAEFQRGTNPAELVFLNETTGRYRWFAAEGKTYHVESSADLNAWTNVETVTGAGEIRTLRFTVSNGQRLFYRLRQD